MKLLFPFIMLFFVGAMTFTENVDAQKYRRNRKFKPRKLRRYRSPNSIRSLRKGNYFTIGASIGAFNYFGDLNSSTRRVSLDMINTRPSLGIDLSYKVNSRFSVRGNLLWGRIKADDALNSNDEKSGDRFRYTRNLSFRNDILEFSGLVVMDLIPNTGSFASRSILTPYIYTGIGIYYHNPKAKLPEIDPHTGKSLSNAGKYVPLRKYGTEGQNFQGGKKYSNIQLNIPFGVGVKYRINPSFDVCLEMTYRFNFNDYLDDVSGEYVDLGKFDDPTARLLSDRSRETVEVETGKTRELASNFNTVSYKGADGNTYDVVAGYGSEGEIRGNSSNNDTFVSMTIRLSYVLGSGGLLRGGRRYR